MNILLPTLHTHMPCKLCAQDKENTATQTHCIVVQSWQYHNQVKYIFLKIPSVKHSHFHQFYLNQSSQSADGCADIRIHFSFLVKMFYIFLVTL